MKLIIPVLGDRGKPRYAFVSLTEASATRILQRLTVFQFLRVSDPDAVEIVYPAEGECLYFDGYQGCFDAINIEDKERLGLHIPVCVPGFEVDPARCVKHLMRERLVIGAEVIQFRATRFNRTECDFRTCKIGQRLLILAAAGKERD